MNSKAKRHQKNVCMGPSKATATTPSNGDSHTLVMMMGSVCCVFRTRSSMTQSSSAKTISHDHHLSTHGLGIQAVKQTKEEDSRFRKSWRRPQILQFCGDSRLTVKSLFSAPALISTGVGRPELKRGRRLKFSMANHRLEIVEKDAAHLSKD